MRPIHALTLALVLALGIAALALFLRAGSKGDDVASADRGAAHAPASDGTKPSTPVELVRPDGDPAHPADTAEQRSSAHAAPAPAAPATARGLRGRVVDGRGRAVAGARVLSDAADIDGVMLDFEFGAEALPGHVEVLTDAEGRFVLEPKAKNQTRLGVRASGFAPFDRGEPVPVDTRDVGDLVLEEGAILTGRVLSPAGRPVADAKLKRLRADAGSGGIAFFGAGFGGGIEVATTDAQGRFRVDQIASGPWKLRVESADHPDKVFEGQTDHPGASVGNLEFVLDEGTTIDGVVLGAPADLMPKLWVRAFPRPSGESGGFAEGSTLFGATRKTKCKADGSFQLRGLKPGTSYRIVGRDSERDYGPGRTCTASVTTPAGERGVKLEYRPETAIVFQVVDATSGAPIEKLEVSGGSGFAMPLMDEKGAPLSSFPGGQVRFVRRDGHVPFGQTAKAFTLHVAANGYEPWTRDDIVPLEGQDTDLGQVRLARAPLVRVTVRDARTKEPVAGASVELVERPLETGGTRRFERNVRMRMGGDEDEDGDLGDSGDSTSARTDKEGRASLTSMPGKRVEVKVRQKEHAPWSSGPIELPAEGDHELDVPLGVGGIVTVEVVDGQGKPVSGLELDRKGPDGQSGMMFGGVRRPRTDASGHATFEHLAVGTQRFRIADGGNSQFMTTDSGDALSLDFGGGGGGGGWSDVEVTEGGASALKLVAPERATLVGRVTEGGKELAGARVELIEDDDGESVRMPFFGGGPNDQTDSKGEYKIERVKLGRYTVRISHSTRAMDWETPLEIQSGENKLHADLPVAILEGRVTGPDGKPLAGVRVRAERAQPEEGGRATRARFVAIAIADDSEEPQVTIGGSANGPTVSTDAEGRYKLRGVTPDVELVVKAQAKDVQPGQSDKVHVGTDQTKSGVDIRLQTGGTIEISLVRADGQPASSCMLLATFEGEGGAEPRNEFSGAKGSVKFTGMKPGRWKLRCDAFGAGPGPGGERPTIPEQTVEVIAGKSASARFEIP